MAYGEVTALGMDIKRMPSGSNGFGPTRIRSLLYASKPNWDLLATVTPR